MSAASDDGASGWEAAPKAVDTDGYLADAVKREEERQQDMAGREATWTVEAEGFDCPLCFHGVEMHDGESCTAPEGYDHLNGFHECGCPLSPPARTTTQADR